MTGIIRFDTVPEKVNIFIDENYIDQSPVDISGTESGVYNYRLSYDEENGRNGKRYGDFVGKLTVYDNRITHITVNMQNGTETENFYDIAIPISENEIEKREEVQFQTPDQIYQVPKTDMPGAPPEKAEDLSAILDSLNDIKSLLGQLLENSNRQSLTNKFDTGLQTLTVAVTTVPQPENVSVTGYTRVAIWDVLGRLSQELYLINNGPGTIFVRKSNDGSTFSSIEIPVFAGEKGTFNNIYELRIRSDIVGTTGTIYRVTEHESNLVINNFDDRAATAQHITWSSSPLDFDGPQPFTAGLTYTVPTGYKAKITGAGVFIRINIGAAVPGQKEIAIILTNPTIGDLFLLTRTIDATHNAVGFVGENSLGFAYTLLTGESLSINYFDTSVVGNVHYAGSIEITQYFSYPT